jgi:sugar phosphate isomerase/epimerase
MRLALPDGTDLRLTYCMNVHPGGSLPSTEQALRATVLPLRERLGARGPFGVGLRFDAETVRLLQTDAGLLALLRDRLAAHDLEPFTANGFVLGAFHGPGVKERVYLPPWWDEERIRYTGDLGAVMAGLAKPGSLVSISTAPGCWRGHGLGEDAVKACARGFVRAARRFQAIEARTGVRLRLGIEPEPGCLLQTTEEVVAFFHGPLADAFGSDAAALPWLGVCYDVCHQAVVGEDVAESLGRLREAGIAIVKLQASTALEVPDPADEAARAALAAFDEPTYLHQVAAREADGRLRVAADLPEALGDEAWRSLAPWRVHFHVPVFRAEVAGGLRTTRYALDAALREVVAGRLCPHVEIETYTFDVLPEAERLAGSGFDLVEALAREYEYVLELLGAHGVRARRALRP